MRLRIEAIKAFKKALKIYKSMGDKHGVARGNLNIEIIYVDLKPKYIAQLYLDKAKATYRDPKDLENLTYVYAIYGSIYYN